MTDRRDLSGLDLVPEAVTVVGRDYTVVHFNDRARALLGFDDEVLGQPLAKALVLRDDADNVCEDGWLPEWVPRRRLAEHIGRVSLPGGGRRPVAISGRFLDDVLVLTFRHAGHRERLDAARSDLVATVSHEIRSPLTSVKGFTSTMLRKWDRFSDEQKRTMLETINHDADRVTRLLKELLAVSRIDAGRLQLHREVFDVLEMLDGLVDRARHHDDGAGREVSVHVRGEIPRLFADPDKIEQVFSNLVENALKYAPGSPIDISVECPDEGGLHITVADDGPGIPRDQTRRIFEKFGRGRGQRRSGTGLGLFITRGLVVAHGGQVWCDSDEGAGARFHVVLPPTATATTG